MTSHDVYKSVEKDLRERLTTVSLSDRSMLVDTPITYPDGSTAVAEVRLGTDGKCFVSDAGLGANVAHLSGSDRWFVKKGEELARIAGIKFDRNLFFTLEVDINKIAGAIVAVTNTSRSAVEYSLFRMSEHRHAENKALMFERIDSAFKNAAIQRDVQLRGASNHSWRVDAVVKTNDHSVAFDAVKSTHQSIFPAMAKFIDLGDKFPKMSRVAVLDKKPKEAEYLTLLSRSAKVILQSDSAETYARAA